MPTTQNYSYSAAIAPSIVETYIQRIRLHVEPLHHIAQQRSAFARAGRVEASLLAHFAGGRGSVPELPHRNGLEAVGIRILQQFGRSTVAGAARRHESPVGEDVEYAAALPFRVEHDVLRKDPALELGGGIGTLLPCGHCGNLGLAPTEIAGRVGQVEDRRDEAGKGRAAANGAAERIQRASVGDEHAQHLALRKGASFGIQAGYEFIRRFHDERMRDVAERICEPAGHGIRRTCAVRPTPGARGIP